MNKTRIFRVPKRLLSTASALVAVSLTHIRYRAGDCFGWVMGWFSLLPIFIALGGFTTLALFRRELQTFFFAVGLLICETSNQVIKSIVREPRPITCGLLEACESYGWPSGHSQFMVFFAIYLTCLATFNFKFSADYVRKVTIGLPWALAPLVMYSRVYLGYHSVTQVLAGASLGVVLGSSWFWCVHRYFHPKFQQLEKSKFCRFFRIRDSSHIPDIIGFEYKVSQKMRSLAQFRQRPHRRPQPRCHRCRRATWD